MECDLGNITLNYEQFGEGRPILMVHGWSLDHFSMMAVMEPVFEGRPGWIRIYPDLPGHGRSPGADWIKNQDGILEVLLAFIDKVIGKERYLVAGISTGAYLARGVIQRRAKQIDGLMLSVPLIVAPDAERTTPAHVTLVEDPAVLADLLPGEEWFPEMAIIQTKELLDNSRTALATEGGIGDAAFQERIRQKPENYGFTFDVDVLDEPFPAPVLIVAGRQDSVVGYQDAWKIIENYPRATFAAIDMAGHLLGLEQRGLFHTLVGEWLDRVEIYMEAAE